MDTRDLAIRYKVDKEAFDAWIVDSGHTFRRRTFGGIDVQDGQDFRSIVEQFKKEQAERFLAIQKAAAESKRAAEEKQRALSSMLITSGFNFDGYTIVKYSGYISGDDAVQIPRGSQGIFGGGTTDVGASLMASLVQIRRRALAELKEAAFALGCNAVIGVDFDYITLDPETATSGGGTVYLPYVFGVTANGNAVVIEKD